MNLSALPELLLAWVKTQGAALLQGNKVEQATPFRVGAEYQGKVLDLLPTGRHLVQVASQKLDMALPRGTQPGETVRLTFLNAGPRPTFLLHQGPVTPVRQVQLSQTAQQVGALLRLAQPPATAAIASAASSPAAMAAGPAPMSASQVAAPPAGPQGAASMVPSPPGYTAPATATPSQAPVSAASAGAGAPRATVAVQAAPLPAALANAAAAQPLASARPIVANVMMLQGAAASLSPTLALASANTALAGQSVDALRATLAAATNLRPMVLADPASPSPNLLPVRLAQTLRESGLFYEAHLSRWTRGRYPIEAILNEPQARLVRGAVPQASLAELGGMPEEAARLAGRQLHMLEGGPFLWQGQVWPGQWMEWLVEERAGGEGEGQEEGAPAPWRTELRLSLPRMGSVNARLDLRGKTLSLDLRAEDGAAAQALRVALPELGRGLEGAGLRVDRLSVQAGEG